jgi:hypothetical protein
VDAPHDLLNSLPYSPSDPAGQVCFLDPNVRPHWMAWPTSLLKSLLFFSLSFHFKGYRSRGAGWYRKHFMVTFNQPCLAVPHRITQLFSCNNEVPAEWQGSPIYVYFEGVFHITKAWLNGQLLGNHSQGRLMRQAVTASHSDRQLLPVIHALIPL